MMDQRIAKLADVLVNYSVAVQPGELVAIQAPPVAEPLVVALYEAVLRAGGQPMVRLAPDVLAELLLKHGSEEQLKYISPLALHEVETIDVRIGIWAETNTKALSRADSGKQAMVSAAREPIMTRFMQRASAKELRWTGSLFPTQASAQDAGMSLCEYEDFVFKAGLLHLDDPAAAWREIARKQQQIVDLLNGGQSLHVQADNGTDISMSMEGRTWINCCGKENFPDGEVFSTPVEDSVNGTIVFSFPAVHMGRECQGVRLTFNDGIVVEASAEKGEDFLIKMLDQDAGARRVGEIAIGTNYGITEYTRNTLFDEKIGGTIHLAVGAAYPETGGKNQSGLHWDMVCDLRQAGEVALDGKPVLTNGKFTAVEF